MNKPNKYQSFDIKKSKKRNNYIEEENVSFREVKRDRMNKHYRNYDNALRSKNLDRLLSYDED
jgi:hypothetical protein